MAKVSASHDGDIPPCLGSKALHDVLVLHLARHNRFPKHCAWCFTWSTKYLLQMMAITQCLKYYTRQSNYLACTCCRIIWVVRVVWNFHMTKVSIVTGIFFNNKMLLKYWSNASYVKKMEINTVEMIQMWFIKSPYSNKLLPEDTELKTTLTSSKVCPIHSPLEFVLNIWRFKYS